MKLFNVQGMEKINARSGIIFDIKRFSVHDGPGIRTSVFLKGCPLSCIWCHNPEGISSDISIWYNQKICIKCGLCIEVCPNKSLGMNLSGDKSIEINYELCKTNGKCVEICPAGALEFTGRSASIDEITEELKKDLLFYRKSGGGVTITGGEPFFQPEFCMEILKACKDLCINTAVETCLYCEKEILEGIVNYVDLFLVDLKIFNSAKHKQFTGKPNHLIKRNLDFLHSVGKDIIIRVPLIKGITNDSLNRVQIEKYVHNLNPDIPVEYLNYNLLTKSKYKKLSIPYMYENI